MDYKLCMGLFQRVRMISLACSGLAFCNCLISYNKVRCVFMRVLSILFYSFLTFLEGQQVKYSVFGDGMFQVIAEINNCIRSYHRPTAEAPLNDLQLHENRIMRKVRVLIEHTYASIDSHFKII